MNERIKKLAEQATSYKWDGYGEEEIEVIDAEKFAELIVRECADYIQHFYGDIAASRIGNGMKLHFGVE
jgi:hypothetical protein